MPANQLGNAQLLPRADVEADVTHLSVGKSFCCVCVCCEATKENMCDR
jgi:hypothetical protein